MSSSRSRTGEADGLALLRETVGRGLDALAKKTADLLELGIYIVDSDCRPVAFAAPAGAPEDFPPQHLLAGIVRALVSSGAKMPAVVPGFKGDAWMCVHPACQREDEVLGYLVAWSPVATPPIESSTVLDVGALAAGIEFSRQQSLWRVRRELEEEFFAHLLSDREHTLEDLARRAEVLDLQLEESYWPCLIDCGDASGYSEQTWAIARRDLTRELGTTFLGINEGVLFVLASNGRGGSAKREAISAALQRLLVYLEANPKTPPFALVTGRSVRLPLISKEWLDLRLTRRVMQGLMRLEGVHYAEEFTLPLLLAGLHRDEADRFVSNIIGRLADYDRENKTRLMRTLETYFDCGCSLSATARATNYHRNTISRQLEKAQLVLGHDLEEPMKRLSLHLATKIHRMLIEA